MESPLSSVICNIIPILTGRRKLIDKNWIGGAHQDGEMDRRRYALEYQREGMTQSGAIEAASRRVHAEAQFRKSFQDAVITLTHTPEYMAAELHVRLDMIRDHIDVVKEHIFDDIVVPVRRAVEAAAEAVITEIEIRSDASGRSDD